MDSTTIMVLGIAVLVAWHGYLFFAVRKFMHDSNTLPKKLQAQVKQAVELVKGGVR